MLVCKYDRERETSAGAMQKSISFTFPRFGNATLSALTGPSVSSAGFSMSAPGEAQTVALLVLVPCRHLKDGRIDEGDLNASDPFQLVANNKKAHDSFIVV
jgi:hypothetical protein